MAVIAYEIAVRQAHGFLDTGRLLQNWVESAIYGDGRMKRNRFSEKQIIGILKEEKIDRPMAHLSRKHGIASVTFYR